MLKNLSLEFAFRKPKPVPVIGRVSWRGYRYASLNGEVCRMASPILGISILITSAPSSARLAAEWGVKMYIVQLSHRIPFSDSDFDHSVPGAKALRQYSS